MKLLNLYNVIVVFSSTFETKIRARSLIWSLKGWPTLNVLSRYKIRSRAREFISGLPDSFVKRILQLEEVTLLKLVVERAQAIKISQEETESGSLS